MEIIEAENGLIAFKKFKQEKPDITFMDLTMPVMDGFEAMGKILEFEKEAVIITLTADIQKKAIDRCISIGAFRVLKKLPQKEMMFSVLDEIFQLPEEA